MYKKAALHLAALFSLGLLTACGTNEEDSSTSSSTASSVTSSAVSSETAQSSNETENVGPPLGINSVVFNTSFGDAVSMYFDTFPNSYIESIAMEEEDGRYEYEIEGFDSENEYDLTIHADNGSILEQNQEQNKNNGQPELILENLITENAAMSTTLEESGTAYVKSWKLETIDGKPVYTISIDKNVDENESSNESEVLIDAETGEVIKTN